MDNSFTLTDITRIAFIDKHEYPEKKTTFSHTLKQQELIYQFEGDITVEFDEDTFHCVPHCVRYLPKGKFSKYVVERKAQGQFILIVFSSNISSSYSHTIIPPLFKISYLIILSITVFIFIFPYGGSINIISNLLLFSLNFFIQDV